MKNIELYPELADYIFNYCGKYFSEKELIANKHLFALAKSGNGADTWRYKFFMKEVNVHEDAEIMQLVEGDLNEFKKKVTKRIFEQHKYELELNVCPNCGKIARTPQAKQCRFCLHDWH